MTGVDRDLATLRVPPGHAPACECRRCEEHAAALARVEAELSRLREEERRLNRYIDQYIFDVEAAEARYARLQQALEEIASTDFDEPSDFSELGRIARTALAGPGSEQSSLTESGSAGLPDTPADRQECDHGITLANKQTGVERCAECGATLPADSQENKT